MSRKHVIILSIACVTNSCYKYRVDELEKRWFEEESKTREEISWDLLCVELCVEHSLVLSCRWSLIVRISQSVSSLRRRERLNIVVNVKDLEFVKRLKQVSLERKFSFSSLFSSSSFFNLSIAFIIAFVDVSTTSIITLSTSLIAFMTLSLSIDMSLLNWVELFSIIFCCYFDDVLFAILLMKLLNL